MKKIMLFLIVCSFVFANTIIDLAAYQGKTDYYNKLGVGSKYILEELHELAGGISFYKSNNNEDLDMAINCDIDYKKEFSPFAFMAYNRNNVLSTDYTRAGVGMAWRVAEGNKVSLALISETSRSNAQLSLRYKLKTKVEKLGLKLVANLLSYSKSLNTKLTYQLEKDIDALLQYKYTEVDGTEDYNTLVGLEIKI